MRDYAQRRLLEVTRIDWETPQQLFDELDAEFHFTLDVCATPQNAKCERYFTIEDDGLKQSWVGERCWMNPPYGRDIDRWVRKAWLGTQAPAQVAPLVVVGLLPVRTDTAWWHDYVEGEAREVRFLRGRVKFGGSRSNAPFPNVIVIWRPIALRPPGTMPTLEVS